MMPIVESLNRSSSDVIDVTTVLGVELNPRAKRKDVCIGSFDDLPNEWEDLFEVVYSNAFDHTHDPWQTAKEWLRIVKNGGFVVLGFVEDEPDEEDPTGELYYEDLLELFPGELIHYEKRGSAYNDIVIRIQK